MLPCGTRKYACPMVSLLLVIVLDSVSSLARIERPRESKLNAERQVKQKTENSAYKFEEGKCVFYCFHISDKYAIISNETVALYKEHTRCSHIVYGEAEIDHRNEIRPPSIYDMNAPDTDITNFIKLKKLSESVKLMLGVRVGTHASWVEDEWKHEIVAANMVNITRIADFSGMFLRLHSDHLYSVEVEHFFEELSKQRAADAQRRSDNSSLTVVLTVSAEWAPHVTERLKNIHPHLSAVYLLSDETSSGNADSTSYSRRYGEPFVAVPVDPLSASSTVLSEDTVRYNAAALEKAQIPREKIVIGLTTWTRSYIVDRKATANVKNADNVLQADEGGDSAVSSFFQNSTDAVMVWQRGAGGPVTRRRDGRLSYFETCKITGFQNATVAEGSASAYFLGVEPTTRTKKEEEVSEEATDESAEAVPMFNQEVVDNQRFSMDSRAQEFYSFNAPNNRSLAIKLKWIAGKGYGGVGFYNLQGDDASEACGTGVLPLHNYLADHFQCTATRRTTERRGTAAAEDGPNNRCVRVCIVDTNHRTAKNPGVALIGNFDDVDPAWCTHLAISPLYVMKTGRLAKKATFGQLIDAYNSWSRPNRPYLVLSIGGAQKAVEWRAALSSPSNRRTLINHIAEHVDEYNADGVDVSYSEAATDQDKEMFGTFLDELRATLASSTKVFVTVNPHTSYANRYNVDALQRNADFIIVQGHLFHSSANFFTGHHTPLFIDLTRLNNPNNTIEGAMKYWVSSGVPYAKLVVGLTAKGLSQGMVFTRNDLSTAIGDTTKPILRPGRSNSPAITQSEVCELMSKNSTKTSFIHDLGVPFLISGEEFVAYDDEKSIQVKAVWASKFGGIAMYAMDMDNADGECPHNNAFHLLKTIYATQVCEMCDKISNESVEEASASSTSETVVKDDLDEAEDLAAFMFVRRRQNANNPLVGRRRRHKRVTTAAACETSKKRKFSVICNYRLPNYAISWLRAAQLSDRRLTLSDLPLEKCDEIVVEEAMLFANGSVGYQRQSTTTSVLDDAGSGAEEDVSDVEQLLTTVPTMVSGGSRVVSSVRCATDMNDNNFKSITGTDEARQRVANLIVKHLRLYGFVGVELRCDHMISADTAKRDAFSTFLTVLHDALSQEGTKEDSLSTDEDATVEFGQKNNDESGNHEESGGVESERSSGQRVVGGEDEYSDNGQCLTTAKKTISIRVPVWRTDISSNYDINVLNTKVHYIAMEASVPSAAVQHVAAAATAAPSLNAGAARRPLPRTVVQTPVRNPQMVRQMDESVSALADPLFNAAPTGKRMSLMDTARVPVRFRNFAISASVAEWLRVGVKRSKIVVQLVAYGHLFTNKSAELSSIVPNAAAATVGAGVDGFGGIFAGVRLPVAVRGPAENDVIMLSGRPLEVEALGRDEVCEIVLSSGTKLHTLYEFVVEMAKTKNDEQLSYESVETVAYKTRYAMRENLAGVALSTLEQDASENFCNEEGEFQLLTSIHHAAKCG